MMGEEFPFFFGFDVAIFFSDRFFGCAFRHAVVIILDERWSGVLGLVIQTVEVDVDDLRALDPFNLLQGDFDDF